MTPYPNSCHDPPSSHAKILPSSTIFAAIITFVVCVSVCKLSFCRLNAQVLWCKTHGENMHSCPDHIVMDAVARQTALSQTELPAMRSGRRSGSSKSPSRRSERRHSPTPYSAQRLHRSGPPLHGKPDRSSTAKPSIGATGDADAFARACEIQMPSVSLSARLDILEQNGTKTCVPEPDGDGFLLHMECEDDEGLYLDEDMIVRGCVETKVSSSNSFNNEVSQTIRDHNSNISVIKDVTCVPFDEEMLESASVNSSSSSVAVSCQDDMSGLLQDSNLNNLPQTFSVELTGENVEDGKTKMTDNEGHDDKKDSVGTKLNACVISLSKTENEIGPGQDISLTCGYRTLPSSLASDQPQTESRQDPRCVCLQRVWNKPYLLPALRGFPPLVFPHNIDTIILQTPQSNPYNPNLPTPCIVLTQYTSYEMCRKCEGYRLWSKSEDCMQVCGEQPLFEKAAVSHSLKLGEEVDFAYHNVNTQMSNGCPDDKCPHKCRSGETELHNLDRHTMTDSKEKTNQEHRNLDSFCVFCSVQQHITACAGQQDVCSQHHSNCSKRKYSLSETETVFSLEPNHAFLEERASACHCEIVPTLRNPENDFSQNEHCWAEGRHEDLQQFWSPVPDCLPSPILSCQVSEAPGPVGEPVLGSSGTSTRADIISRLRRVVERRLSGTDEPGYLRNNND